jgi:hypothetical protein
MSLVGARLYLSTGTQAADPLQASIASTASAGTGPSSFALTLLHVRLPREPRTMPVLARSVTLCFTQRDSVYVCMCVCVCV